MNIHAEPLPYPMRHFTTKINHEVELNTYRQSLLCYMEAHKEGRYYDRFPCINHLLSPYEQKNAILRAHFYLTFPGQSYKLSSLDRKKLSLIFIFLLLGLYLLKTNIYFYALGQTVYLLQIAIKAAVSYKALSVQPLRPVVSNMSPLPPYTIMIVLNGDSNDVANIVKTVEAMDYPKHLLDVKLIVRQEEVENFRRIYVADLPFYFHIIRIPELFLKTRSSALNYAVQFAVGQYVVVYDSYDAPDPKQLKKVLAHFISLPEKYVCAQCKIDFRNKNENLLTKCFSVEYKVWFQYFLGGLMQCDMPILLSTSSAHFKTEYLRGVGYWDSCNVTQDIDLGLRIYLSNLRVSILDSYTMSVAPSSLWGWIARRARWIKGFILTLHMYLKQKRSHLAIRQRIVIKTIFILNCYAIIYRPLMFFFYGGAVQCLPKVVFYL